MRTERELQERVHKVSGDQCDRKKRLTTAAMIGIQIGRLKLFGVGQTFRTWRLLLLLVCFEGTTTRRVQERLLRILPTMRPLLPQLHNAFFQETLHEQLRKASSSLSELDDACAASGTAGPTAMSITSTTCETECLAL